MKCKLSDLVQLISICIKTSLKWLVKETEIKNRQNVTRSTQDLREELIFGTSFAEADQSLPLYDTVDGLRR